MAYTITSESYGRRIPKITATADGTDDLATLGIDWAEGSSCVIGTKTYVLDKVSGWVESGSVGGGGNVFYATIEFTDTDSIEFTCDKTFDELKAAYETGELMFAKLRFINGGKVTLEETTSISTHLVLTGDEIDWFTITQPAHVSPEENVSQYEFYIHPDPADNSAEFYAFTGVDSNP